MTLRRKSVSRAIICFFRFYPSYNGYRARPEILDVCHFAENCHNFLSLTSFGLENIDPRSPKLLALKFTGVPFHLPSLVTLALIEAEIAGRGRICSPPPSRARDSQTLSSARVNPRPIGVWRVIVVGVGPIGPTKGVVTMFCLGGRIHRHPSPPTPKIAQKKDTEIS